MKKTLVIALLASVLPLMAQTALAETMKFPSDAPVAVITIPDSWSPQETDSGIEAESEDSAVYLSVDVADMDAIEKVTTDAVVYLQKNGVVIDEKTQKETPVTDMNGMKLSTIEWDAQDNDGPVSVGLVFIATSPSKALVMTYWGSKGDEDKHGNALAEILASVKPAH